MSSLMEIISVRNTTSPKRILDGNINVFTSFVVSKKMYETITRLVDEGYFNSRMEVIRAAVIWFLKHYKEIFWPDEQEK